MTDGSSQEFSSHLRVTERDLNTICNFVHFKPEDLPKGAVIINNGGGVRQQFEEELKKVLPDVKIITIDPSTRSTNALLENTDTRGFHYPSQEEIRDRINNMSNRSHTVEAWGQEMPLKEGIADAIFDIHAASQWAKDIEAYKNFLQEAMRVLKSGGKLYIGNVFWGDPVIDDKEEQQKSLDEAKKTFEALGLSAEVFLSTERIISEHNGKKNVPDLRICAIVTKK